MFSRATAILRTLTIIVLKSSWITKTEHKKKWQMYLNCIVYKFQCRLCNESYYDECVQHLNVRIGKQIGISPLTKKKVKLKGCVVRDSKHSSFFESFSVSTKQNRKFALKLKEPLLKIRGKSSVNRNIRSAPLYLFDRV